LREGWQLLANDCDYRHGAVDRPRQRFALCRANRIGQIKWPKRMRLLVRTTFAIRYVGVPPLFADLTDLVKRLTQGERLSVSQQLWPGEKRCYDE
jgi:hypothetical protein